MDRPFRLENELMPSNCKTRQLTDLESIIDDGPMMVDVPSTDSEPMPVNSLPSLSQPSLADYSQATLDDLLREVDSLQLPEFEKPFQLPGDDLEKPITLPNSRPSEDTPRKEVILSPILQKSTLK